MPGCGGPDVAGSGGPRIVSLVPSATEVVYALGAGGQLVGNTTYCTYPERARSVYKVGDFVNPDIERIAVLRPDIVLLTLPTHRLVADRLAELGLRFHISQPRTIEETLGEIDSIGVLLGRRGRARSLTDSLRLELGQIPAAPDSPRVYVEISLSPLMSVGARTFMNELVEYAGGRNVYAFSGQQYPLVEAERVVRADPEVIIVLHPGASAQEIASRVGWSGISAVEGGRIYTDIDDDLVTRPGPRLVEAVKVLAERLSRRTGSCLRQRSR
ncbi:MAG: cobalamin-binding protein [candidate division WOR-3 bacterium]|nr:MAG: cobalamin-binding protein [candidate division WOR-3 bacterium]